VLHLGVRRLRPQSGLCVARIGDGGFPCVTNNDELRVRRLDCVCHCPESGTAEPPFCLIIGTIML
jgi:hypothetical protein